MRTTISLARCLWITALCLLSSFSFAQNCAPAAAKIVTIQNTPPILTVVWLTTFGEVTTDSLGAIWMRPRDYRDITEGTAFDPRRPPERVYRR